jgi:hypothetical protein
VGLAAEEVMELMNQQGNHSGGGFSFEQWYAAILHKELDTFNVPSLSVLRSRISWLVGQWAEFVPTACRDHIYNRLSVLMTHNPDCGTDIVVRYTAANGLQQLVSSEEFLKTADSFANKYAHAVIANLFSLVNDLNEHEHRTDVMSMVSMIVQSLGARLSQQTVNVLLQGLPVLWKQCKPSDVLRNDVIITMGCLVRMLGPRSLSLHDFLSQMIVQCLTVKECYFLEEDAYDLWIEMVTYSPVLSNELTQLLLLLIQKTSNSLEHLSPAMHLIDSYILLGGSNLIAGSQAGNAIAQLLQNLYGNVRHDLDDGLCRIAEVLETIAQVVPAQAFLGMFQGTLQKMIQQLLLDKTNPANKRTKHSDKVLTRYLHILARLLATAYQPTLQLMGGQNNLLVLVREWCRLFDCISQPYHVKLSAVALINCLSDPALVKNGFTGPILTCATAAMAQCDNGESLQQAVLRAKQLDAKLHTEAERITLLTANDPVTTVDIKTIVVQKLQGLQQTFGPQAMQQLMGQLDPVILQPFK